jgi:hypothetical protein
MDAARGGLYSQIPPQSRRSVRAPRLRADGVSQTAATYEWEVHQRVLVELEQRATDPLMGIRIGNRVWYSRAQLTSLLGEPKRPPFRPAKMGPAAKGG